jgi:cobalt-zinc-cadmium efflux system outer membrane protein
MPTRARVCAWIAGFGLVMPAVAMAQDRSEREVVELIVRDGPQARAIRAEPEVTRREQFARLAYPNPSVLYSREGAGFTEFLQAEQLLPVFGTRGALGRAGASAIAAAEAERDARLWRLRGEAARIVARLGAASSRLDAAQDHTRAVERLLEILRAREREGEGSRFDRLRAEQELREARLTAAAAAADAAEARAQVTAMLPTGTALTRVTGIPGPRPGPAAVESLVARATSARAELRALLRTAERANEESDASRRARLPAPTVFGGLKRADAASGRERGGILGVSVSLPIFDNGRRDAARWDAVRARSEAEHAALEGRIRAEIAGAVEVLALRHGTLADAQDEGGDELLRIAEVAYREGEIGILELLDAARTASRARTRGIEARLDARLAEIALEQAVGETLWP